MNKQIDKNIIKAEDTDTEIINAAIELADGGGRPRIRTAEQRPTYQVQLQQEVDRVETGVGLQENQGRFQGLWQVLRMIVWGLLQDRTR